MIIIIIIMINVCRWRRWDDAPQTWTDEVRTDRCYVSKHDANYDDVAQRKHTPTHCAQSWATTFKAGDQRDSNNVITSNIFLAVRTSYAAFMGLASPNHL